MEWKQVVGQILFVVVWIAINSISTRARNKRKPAQPPTEPVVVKPIAALNDLDELDELDDEPEKLPVEPTVASQLSASPPAPKPAAVPILRKMAPISTHAATRARIVDAIRISTILGSPRSR